MIGIQTKLVRISHHRQGITSCHDRHQNKKFNLPVKKKCKLNNSFLIKRTRQLPHP